MANNWTTRRRLQPEDRKGKQTQNLLSALCVFFAAFVSTPSAGQMAGGWPQFRGDARLSGHASADLPATLALKWTYEAGETIESSAAIVDGVVYVGSTKGELTALDLATGKRRWTYSTGENGFIGESSAAVSDGVVFIGDLAGVVHAVS